LIDVPGEAQLTGYRIVASNDARSGPAALAIEHLMTGDDDSAHDDRRRGDGGRPWRDRRYRAVNTVLLRQSNSEVGGAVLAEILAWLTRLRVHGDQAHVERSLDDALCTGLVGCGVGIPVEGHTSARRGVRHPFGRDLRVVHPQLLAGRCIEREHLVHRRTAVDGIADFEWRQLRSVLLRNVAGMESPGALELLDICGRDLAEVRIALCALAAAIGAPLTLVGGVRCIFEERLCVRSG